MKILKKVTFFLLLIFVLLACENHDDSTSGNGSSDSFTENFGSTASRDFMGQVIDENENPIINARVSIGNSITYTDNSGIFIIKNASVYEKFAYIKVEKIGFLKGSRSLVPTDAMNQVKIMLIANAPIATVNSGETSEVELSNGTKVNFDGAFQDENGNSYTGNINVFAYHLESSNVNLMDLMPGMLFAEAEDGSAKILETFGMLNVELVGNGGQKLQIAQGHTAQITMKIDDSQLSTATSTIPLWHFDETDGYWKEEGQATRQGDYYVGNVSHFSWWNYDAYLPTVFFNVRLLNTNNEPLAYISVMMDFQGIETHGMTMSNGIVSGLIPANELLTLTILDECNNIVLSRQIGPYSVDTNYGDIVVDIPLNSQTLVTGTLLKCDGNPVENGYVYLSKNGEYDFFEVTNGAFNINKTYCPLNTEFKLKGVDYDNLQVTDSITYNFEAPITNVGNLMTCNSVSEFISYQIDSDPIVYIVSDINVDFTTYGLSIFTYTTPIQNGILLSCSSNLVGIQSNFSIEGGDVGLIDQSSPEMTFLLNYFGAFGDYIDVSFYGNYIDYNNQNRTIRGVAHVIRDN